MMKTIIAASILALATMSSPAFAYSNVSPKPTHHSRTRHHLSPNAASSFNFAPGWGYERTAPSVHYETFRPSLQRSRPEQPWRLGWRQPQWRASISNEPHTQDPGVGGKAKSTSEARAIVSF